VIESDASVGVKSAVETPTTGSPNATRYTTVAALVTWPAQPGPPGGVYPRAIWLGAICSRYSPSSGAAARADAAGVPTGPAPAGAGRT
jgi:hypothetical protein